MLPLSVRSPNAHESYDTKMEFIVRVDFAGFSPLQFAGKHHADSATLFSCFLCVFSHGVMWLRVLADTKDTSKEAKATRRSGHVLCESSKVRAA
jgi:uncharacterized membrane protein